VRLLAQTLFAIFASPSQTGESEKDAYVPGFMPVFVGLSMAYLCTPL